MFNFTPKIDSAQVQQKVQADINNAQSKKISMEEFVNRVNQGKQPWETFEQAANIALKEATSRWFIIEWYNDSSEQVKSQVRQSVQPNAMQKMLWGSIVWLRNLTRWAVSAIPEAAWNVVWWISKWLWFLSNIITPEFAQVKNDKWENLAQVFWQAVQDLWVDSSDKLKELLWVDPDAFMTKTGEFITNVWGTMAIPLWSATKAPKIVQTGLSNLQTKAPQLYNILTSSTLSSAWRWAVEAGKFGIVSEWEISPTGVVIWAVANPILWKIWQWIKWTWAPDKILRSITWVRPSEVKKLWYKTIKEDANIVVKSIKEYLDTPVERNINWKIVKALPDAPQTRWELLELLQNRQRDIYDKNILPLLKKAGENGEVKLTWITDDIIDKLYPRVKWVSLMEWLGWKTDEMAQITNFWKNIEKQPLSFEELEIMKSALSASLRQWWNPNVVGFLWQVNKRLQEQYDDLLSKVTGQWVKTLKREYAAIANMKDPLYAKVAQEMRDSGMDLVSQLWFYSTILQWVKWDVKWAARSFLSLKILQKLRDPNTALRSMIEQIYWKEQSTRIIDTLIGIGASEAWNIIENDF